MAFLVRACRVMELVFKRVVVLCGAWILDYGFHVESERRIVNDDIIGVFFGAMVEVPGLETRCRAERSCDEHGSMWCLSAALGVARLTFWQSVFSIKVPGR